MELRHIYRLTDTINQTLGEDVMVGARKEDLVITVEVKPATLYAIEREFYKQSHNNSTNGFEPTQAGMIEATIDGVKFIIKSEKEENAAT